MKTQSWLAHPWLSALLAATWLLLQHSIEPVHLLSAALIGLILPRLLHNFLPQAASIRVVPAVRLLRFVLGHLGIQRYRGAAGAGAQREPASGLGTGAAGVDQPNRYFFVCIHHHHHSWHGLVHGR